MQKHSQQFHNIFVHISSFSYGSYNRLLSKLNMVEEFLGIRFYKKRSVVDLHEHFLGSNDDKITHQIKFRKKSNKVLPRIPFIYSRVRVLMEGRNKMLGQADVAQSSPG